MSLDNLEKYHRSEYEKALEATINTNVATLSANVITISSSMTAVSSALTAMIDFATVVESSATFTLSLLTNRSFTLTNDTSAAKTLYITDIPTASDTLVDVNLALIITLTAAITYTASITWEKATAPSATASGTYLINLKSLDAGVNWLGSFTGLY